MKNLLYKEFKLTISSGFFLLALLGALVLIPSWLYFFALMYAMFISIPQIFTAAKAQNDIGFSVMLPVRKRDVVKARVVSILLIETLHILVAAVFAAANILIYKGSNFFMDANVAFFGLAFVMFAIFNLVFFPAFYKNGYKVGVPTIIATAAAFVFMVAVEGLVMFVPTIGKYLDNTKEMQLQLPVLFIGIALFVLSAVAAYRISAKWFEKVDL